MSRCVPEHALMVIVFIALGLVISPGIVFADLWTPQVLPYSPTLSGGLGFALDSSDNPGITFQDSTSGGLYYGYYSSGSWATAAAIDTGTYTGRGSALVYEGAIPHVSYRDSDNSASDVGSLAYATKPGGSWSLTTVDNAAETNPRHTAIALDSSDNPAIAYVDQHGLGTSDDTIDYAYYDGSTWHIEKIADKPRVLAGTDLALPGSNTAAQVAYSDDSGWYKLPVHATRTGSWTLDTGLGGEVSAEDAAYMAMDLDGSGNPAIAYLDTGTGDVRFAIYDGSDWSVETVLSGDADDAYDDWRYLDMAFDSMGYAHLVYYDLEAGQLSYSYRSGSSWHTTHTWELDAYWIALDIDSNNAPHFAYYDNSDGNAYIIDGQAIPEPATMVLFGLGLLGLGARLRRRTT